MAGPGLDPKIWGPTVWKWIHNIAYRWDNSKRKTSPYVFLNTIEMFKDMLPCRSCREAFSKHFATLALLHHSQHFSALRWTYDLHCMVNNTLDKPSPPYRDVVEYVHKKENVVNGMLHFFFAHYDNSGVRNKKKVYDSFMKHLIDLYRDANQHKRAFDIEVIHHLMTKSRVFTSAILLDALST